MKKIYKKGIIILFICYVSIIVIIGSKIIVNKRFIKNYPDAEQGARLLFISMLNFYEPYIAPYNYGNYYYKQGRYEEAYEKYKEALKYKIPLTRQCAVDINISLSIIKIAKRKNKDEEFALYEEAKGYLNNCLTLDFPEKKDDKKPFDDEEDEDDKKDKNDEMINTANDIKKKIDSMISDFNGRSGGSLDFNPGGSGGTSDSGTSSGGGGGSASIGGGGSDGTGGSSQSPSGGGGGTTGSFSGGGDSSDGSGTGGGGGAVCTNCGSGGDLPVTPPDGEKTGGDIPTGRGNREIKCNKCW